MTVYSFAASVLKQAVEFLAGSLDSRLRSIKALKLGTAMLANMATRTNTIINSIREKPALRQIERMQYSTRKRAR